MKKLTVEQVSAMLDGTLEIPEQWKPFLNGKRREGIVAWVKGFYFDNKHGDMCTAIEDELTYSLFSKVATRQGEVRVWLPPAKAAVNKARDNLSFLLDLAKNSTSLEVEAMKRKARQAVEKAESPTCKWLHLKDYEQLYAEGKPHEVDLVMERFFEHFPNARERRS